MPRVSEAHRTARRRQVLVAARTCFVRNGFHTTSMQDVIAAAGLSVGAVYRYFRSKEELIRAIAEDVVGELESELDQLLDARPLPSLPYVMDGVLRVVEAKSGPDGAVRLGVQVWGEALRDPRLADLVAVVYRRIRGRFVDLARRARDEGQLPPGAAPERIGAVLFGLIPGYFLQLLFVGDVDRAGYLAGFATLLGSRPVGDSRP